MGSPLVETPSIPPANYSRPQETVTLQPPPHTIRPSRTKAQKFRVAFFGFAEYSWSKEETLVFCARKRRSGAQSLGMKFGTDLAVPYINFAAGPVLEVANSHTYDHQTTWNPNCRYIIVGIIGHEESIPHETLRLVEKPEDLFKQIHKAEHELRSPFRRTLSLKRVSGFGLYRCHPSQDYHSNPDTSDETTRCLAELYRNYRTEKQDYQDRWMDWIHQNFNGGSMNPEMGIYALQLRLKWSPIKLVIWSMFPILLSLAIGLWYMLNPQPTEDYVAVVQTAWTMASYIVTTAARK